MDTREEEEEEREEEESTAEGMRTEGTDSEEEEEGEGETDGNEGWTSCCSARFSEDSARHGSCTAIDHSHHIHRIHHIDDTRQRKVRVRQQVMGSTLSSYDTS